MTGKGEKGGLSIFDIDTLEMCCMAHESYFTRFGETTYTNKNGSFYVYQDNHAKVLGVAHLDTVSYDPYFDVKKHRVYSMDLDDRLGVYILLFVLKGLGIKYDILLTTDEEIGNSTAMDFYPVGLKEKYNWIFEFDRRSDGVVLYQYDDKPTRNLMKKFGFRVDIGSYSDISYLDSFDVKAFNFGTGYYNEHTKNCYANLYITKTQIYKFLRFYHANKDKRLEHSVDYYGVDDYYGRKWGKNWFKNYKSTGWIDGDWKDETPKSAYHTAIQEGSIDWMSVECPECKYYAESPSEAQLILEEGYCQYCYEKFVTG